MTTGHQRMRNLIVAWIVTFILLCLHGWLFVAFIQLHHYWRSACECGSILVTGYCLVGITAYLEIEDHEHRGIYYWPRSRYASALHAWFATVRRGARKS